VITAACLWVVVDQLDGDVAFVELDLHSFAWVDAAALPAGAREGDRACVPGSVETSFVSAFEPISPRVGGRRTERRTRGATAPPARSRP
jgi:hypothetical protein